MFVTRISSPQELQEVMLRTSAQQPNQEVIMNTVTEAQVNYINRLQAERRWEDIPALEQQVADARFAWRKGQFSKRDASLLIHNLDLAHRRETAVVEQEAASIEGMHRLDGQIYKVQVAVHGSGREHAKVLVTEQTGTCGGCEKCDGEDRCPVYASRFEYAAGMVRRLSAATRLTLEEAKAFGALYGSCCVCSRTLTKEESIAAGIGPICAGKF